MSFIFKFTIKKLGRLAEKTNENWALRILYDIHVALERGCGAILTEPDCRPPTERINNFIKDLRAEGFKVTYSPESPFKLNIEWADNKKELQAFLEE